MRDPRSQEGGLSRGILSKDSNVVLDIEIDSSCYVAMLKLFDFM
ncbi:MAG: hypothetical protein ACTSVZ_13745 [Promethearchaeota archaeon]